jgi:hypothetical protein
MIDREARREAKAISQGDSIEPTTDSKVALYGLLARIMDPADLPDRLGSDTQPKTFREIEWALFDAVGESADAGLNALEEPVQQDIHNLMNKRAGSARDILEKGLGAKFTSNRLEQGRRTGARAEILTLRTIAMKQSKGAVVTEGSLRRSVKIPLSIASIHLRNLPMATLSYAKWSMLEGGDEGEVFGSRDVSWDPTKGLNFVNVHEDLVPGTSRLDNEPQIGCPATLVEEYVQKIHYLAATAALESGLIEIS